MIQYTHITFKWVMGCILLFVAGHVYGTTRWGTYDNYKGNGYTYSEGAFEFTSDYVWTNFNVAIDGWPIGRLFVNNFDIKEIGYYKILSTDQAGNNETSDKITLWQQDNKGNVIVSNSTVFEKGDKIGIYMNINGKYLSTTDTSISGVAEAYTNVDPNKKHFGLFPSNDLLTSHYEYFLEGVLNSREGESSEDFMERVNKEIEENNYNVLVTTSNGEYLPLSGSPLPSLFITVIMIGIAMSGGHFLLPKQNKTMQ